MVVARRLAGTAPDWTHGGCTSESPGHAPSRHDGQVTVEPDAPTTPPAPSPAPSSVTPPASADVPSDVAPDVPVVLAPVAPFGATVRGVLDLLPDASLAATRPADPTPGGSAGAGTTGPTGPSGAPLGRVTRAVSVEEVAGWLAELSATVALTCDGWTRLPADVSAAPDGTTAGLADRDAFVLEARRLVHAGAGSYLEAARARGGSGPNTTTTGYAEVLWARFVEGLAALAAYLTRRLASGDPSTPDPGDAAGGGGAGAAGLAVGNFPAPAIGRRTGF